MGLFDWLRGKTKARAPDRSGGLDPRETFALEIEARLRAVAGVERVHRNPGDQLALQVTGAAGEQTMYLDNLFHETRELDPQARENLVSRHLRMATTVRPSFDSWEEAEPHVLVSLRAPLGGAPAELELAAHEVVPCLRELLVLDSEEEILLVTTEQLQKWAISFDQAVEAGRARLAAAATGEVLHDAKRRIWTVDTNDAYEASRLLVPGFLASFVGRVNGRPIAVVPAREQIFVGGDADPAVVFRLCELAEREFAASPRRISAAIYTRDSAGALERWRPEGPSPWARRARESHVRFEGTEYAAQQEELQAASGDEVFVASFSGLEHEQAGLQSYCTWTDGIQSLLPRTDLVALVGTAGAPVLVPWEEVVRIAGPKLQRAPRLYPHRWRTVASLDEAELAALRAFEVRPGG